MGSFSLPAQSLHLRSSSSCSFSPCCISLAQVTLEPLSVLWSCSFHLAKMSHSSNLRHLPRAIPDGIQNEVIEDSKFVPLNADDPTYGPPALLLMGFEAEDTDKVKQLLKEMGGDFLKIIHCTEDMINRSLWEAMHTQQSNLKAVKIAKSLPRICFMSGLSGEEMMMFIDAFPETGLQPAIFAALVPNSANKLLAEVMEEIMGDHEMMSAIQSEQQ